jgi:hypothetical protein
LGKLQIQDVVFDVSDSVSSLYLSVSANSHQLKAGAATRANPAYPCE